MEKFERSLVNTHPEESQFPRQMLCTSGVIKKWLHHDGELKEKLLERLSNSR